MLKFHVTIFHAFREISRQLALRSSRFIVLNDSASSNALVTRNNEKEKNKTNKQMLFAFKIQNVAVWHDSHWSNILSAISRANA